MDVTIPTIRVGPRRSAAYAKRHISHFWNIIKRVAYEVFLVFAYK
jgi:hypothetical protein